MLAYVGSFLILQLCHGNGPFLLVTPNLNNKDDWLHVSLLVKLSDSNPPTQAWPQIMHIDGGAVTFSVGLGVESHTHFSKISGWQLSKSILWRWRPPALPDHRGGSFIVCPQVMTWLFVCFRKRQSHLVINWNVASCLVMQTSGRGMVKLQNFTETSDNIEIL